MKDVADKSGGRAVSGIESGLKRQSDYVYRVDVVPMGGAQDIQVPPKPRPTA
jgi:hypothetical protein